MTSHPRWLIERWSDAFGYDRAAAIASANNVQPPLAFRYTRRAKDRIRSGDVVESLNIEGCFLTGKITDELTEKAVRGEIYFQDETSQMLGAAVQLDAPGRIADICAAPGGKLTQIVSNHPDSSVVAVDISYARLEIMRKLLGSRGVEKVGIVQANAEGDLPFDERSFDHVIVDAPCSGTGTIRHNPELRYLISEAAIRLNQTKQLQILRQASKLVKGGGSLIYSTCSLETDENEEVIRGFREHAADEFETREPNVPARFLEGNGFARTFPDRDGLDGFFMASFRRR